MPTQTTQSPTVIRFAGRVEAPAPETAQTTAAEILAEQRAKIEAGQFDLAEAAQRLFEAPREGRPSYDTCLRLKGQDLATLVLPFARHLLQSPSLDGVTQLLDMMYESSRHVPKRLAASRVQAWGLLAQIAESKTAAGAKFWTEAHMRTLQQLVHDDRDVDLDAMRRTVLTVAQHAEHPPVRREWTRDPTATYRLSVRDYLVGGLLDRLWAKAPDVDDLVAEAMSLAPRSVLWLRHPTKGPKLTRELFEFVLPRLDPADGVKEEMLKRVPLDWMSPKEAHEQVTGGIGVWRILDYAGATPDMVRCVIERIFDNKGLGFWRLVEEDVRKIAQLPHLKDLIDDTDWARDLFSRPVSDNVPFYKMLAQLQSDHQVASDLLLQCVRTTVSEAKKRPNFQVHQLVWRALATCLDFVERSDVRHGVSAVSFAQFVRDSGVDPVADGRRKTGYNFRGAIDETAKRAGLSRAERDTLLEVFVEIGDITIASLPKADQRLAVVGAAIRRDPKRLEEVTDLKIFKRLARQLDIAVEVPSEIELAEQRRSQALEAIDGAAAPARAKTRRPA